VPPIIDCNTLFGFWQKDIGDRSLTRLLHILSTNRIDRALTMSGRGVWDDVAEGNQETLEVCAAHPELIPVATLRPHEYFGVTVRGLRKRGFRMIRFFPALQNWSTQSLCFRRIIEDLVAEGLPLFFEEGTPIAPLLDQFAGSNLPLIFSGVSYGLGEFLAACELYPQCYTDTLQLFLLNQMEIIHNEVGIEHILFGTKAPFEMPGPSLENVRYARLTDEEKGQITSGNILRLIGEEG
jgi:predicted TIM-barrel fold metal-dependent hydrolase